MQAELEMGKRFGVASREQVVGWGATRRQIAGRLDSGMWERVHRGVYRLAVVSETWQGSLYAACLATGGVASHRSAAGLLIGDIARTSIVEVTVPVGHHPKPAGVIVHETTQWDLRDQRNAGVIPVTGVDRTLLDCAAVTTGFRLERLCEAAIRQRKSSWVDLARTLMKHSRKGRNGCGKLRALLEVRFGTEVTLSDFSLLVANLLIENGVAPPLVEHRIYTSGGDFIMQADLAWPDRRKICETDGLAWHFGRAEREQDNRKRNRAKAEGWNIYEALWSMYVDDPDELVAQIRQFLAH